MNKNFIPAVSIIISMYNVEKYVGFCLESVLVQTFQDYEVIVVDDCSTDNSCAIVESYKSKFAGKLKLIRSKKNSSISGGSPRNIGVKNSCGEYIFFLDSDDFITETALEEMYTIAKDFDADVVDCQKYFEVRGDNIKIQCHLKCEIVKRPKLITDDLEGRVKELVEQSFVNALWTKLIRRKFFIDYDFPLINVLWEDALTTYCMVCTAKNYVRVPNIINFYRIRDNSIYNRQREVADIFKTWLKALTQGFKYVDEFLDKQKFFRDNVNLKFIVLERIVQEFNSYLIPLYEQISAIDLDPIIRAEFARAGDISALSAFLYSRMNLLNVQLLKK